MFKLFKQIAKHDHDDYYDEKDDILRLSDEGSWVSTGVANKKVFMADEIWLSKICYHRKNVLGAGGQGVVYRYRQNGRDSKKLGLAVKVALAGTENDREDLLARNVYAENADCGTIPLVARAYGTVDQMEKNSDKDRPDLSVYYIMPECDGDLENYLETTDSFNDYKYYEAIFKIFTDIKQRVLCLAELGHYYLDLKPEQVLFIKNKKSDLGMDLYLADLGSMVKEDDIFPKDLIYTFPYPTSCNKDLPPTKKALDWALGTFALSLSMEDKFMDEFVYDHPKCKTWISKKGLLNLKMRIDETYPMDNKSTFHSKVLNQECKHLLVYAHQMDK